MERGESLLLACEAMIQTGAVDEARGILEREKPAAPAELLPEFDRLLRSTRTP